MNPRKLIKISNMVALAAVVALIFWIILDITVQVFKISVFGLLIVTNIVNLWVILSLLAGAFMLSVMFNLSIIAAGGKTEETSEKKDKLLKYIFLGALPAIVCLALLGNFISEKSIENKLQNSADEVIETYAFEISKMAQYAFTREWINSTARSLELMEKTEQDFDMVRLILTDEINKNKVYLTFYGYNGGLERNAAIDKIDYIEKSKLNDRNYFGKIFNEDYKENFFLKTGSGKQYELCVPVEEDGRTMILVFTHRKK
jgi:hypothetical protein